MGVIWIAFSLSYNVKEICRLKWLILMSSNLIKTTINETVSFVPTTVYPLNHIQPRPPRVLCAFHETIRFLKVSYSLSCHHDIWPEKHTIKEKDKTKIKQKKNYKMTLLKKHKKDKVDFVCVVGSKNTHVKLRCFWLRKSGTSWATKGYVWSCRCKKT